MKRAAPSFGIGSLGAQPREDCPVVNLRPGHRCGRSDQVGGASPGSGSATTKLIESSFSPSMKNWSW